MIHENSLILQSHSSFTLMGDNKEVLIMDLFTLYFTLQHLGWDYFFQLRVGKQMKHLKHTFENE